MTAETPFVPLAGRCRCEHVRFQLETAPMITHRCHCRLWQRACLSAFGTIAMIETDRLTSVQGNIRFFQGARNHKEVQCPECGCTLWIHRADLGDAVALVSVGMLDEPECLPPEAHYFIRSKHPWLTLPLGIPAFQALGDAGKSGFRERTMGVLASSGAGPAAP